MNPDNKNKSTRRELFKKVAQSAGLLGVGGMMWGAYVDEAKSSDLVLRPPGALDEKDFLKACVKCGTCVESCPYNTLKLAVPGDNIPVGTPHFKPREIPCYMCPDIPCVPVCPSGALDIKKVSDLQSEESEEKLNINKAKMGVAVVDKESCLAFWGIQCDACYRACPLLGEAITIELKRNERTGKHAYLEPVINREKCTGCGLCEHACITEKPAVFILPFDKATGKVGEHYIKGWDENDEKRLNNIKESGVDKQDDSSVEDYLNDWESLIDE
ncbi:MAG: ferredoxin-type protein NapG [Bacteroidales bacterium]|nr:ferredoxin-type protein NapG [Bacteroidales bacterium]